MKRSDTGQTHAIPSFCPVPLSGILRRDRHPVVPIGMHCDAASCPKQGLDWDDLAEKKIGAPFVPKIAGELDVSNFAEEFTSMVPADSPALAPASDDKIFKVREAYWNL